MPGVTIRKPRLNRLLVGERTAFTICQAISVAITVVLPLPVFDLNGAAKTVSTKHSSAIMALTLGDSFGQSMRLRFSVHTGANESCHDAKRTGRTHSIHT